MSNKNTTYLSALFLGAALLLSPKFALAQYYSQGSSTQSLVVDKLVRTGEMNTYYDNLTANQKVFIDGDVIEFKIVVKNSGSDELTKISVTDKLPKYLDLLFFPGTLDKVANSINWTIDKLAVGESKEYLVRAKISGSDKLGNVDTKMINTASGCASNNVCDSDTASYIAKGKAMPTTGSKDLILETSIFISAVVAGVGIRKLARGY